MCRARAGRASCPGGGIGRRTSFRYWRVTPWRFESSSGHHSSQVLLVVGRAVDTNSMSKLYDQLKQAAFDRKAKLERTAAPKQAASPAASPTEKQGRGRKQLLLK